MSEAFQKKNPNVKAAFIDAGNVNDTRLPKDPFKVQHRVQTPAFLE